MGQLFRPAAIGAAALLALFLSGSAAAARGPVTPESSAAGRRALPGVVVVQLRDAITVGKAATASGLASVDAVLGPHGVSAWMPVLQDAPHVRKAVPTGLERAYLVHYADGTAPETVAAAIAHLPGVEFAEPHWMYPLCVTPNDPNYTNQSTYLTRMHFPQGWDVTKGEQGSAVVAIVDGGTAWQHADLQASVWTNPGETASNGLDDDHNGFVDDVHGWNFANGTNDPTGLPSTPNNADHGTHTAGIACAVTNNSTGIAGTSWNAKLMPVCTSSPTTDNLIAYGYEGILYAAENGADVINCSWGGLGSPSLFEQEVIDYVWGLGAAVVAAAGNDTSPDPHFPSAYRHVLSVANVSRFDVLVSSSNRGTTVDVSAQGQNIYSTVPGGYALMTGTSMSSPQVAGLCALVKTRWPGYSPDQVLERVRVTSDNIDASNPSFAGLVGYGRVNAENALKKNTPALRITALHYTETDGDGIIEPGETVQITPVVTNFLAACSGVTFKLRETSTYTSVADSVTTVGGLDSLQSVELPPLSLHVGDTTPIQTLVNCMLQITTTSPAYTDRDRFQLTVLPTYVDHDINNVKMSVTSVGKLGFSVSAGGTGADGIGFSYQSSANLLFEGALMMGTSEGTISDAARGNSPTISDDDFGTVSGGVPRKTQPGTWAPQQTVATFNDALAAAPLPVLVRQDSYAYTDPLHDDYVIVRYAILNTGASALTGLRVGWFCDWDIDGGTYDTNQTGFDAARNLGYVYDSGLGPHVYVGTQVLTAPGATSCRGITNDQAIAPDWGVYDNFTDAEKWQCLSGGMVHPAAGPADISQSIATGPFTVAAGDSVEVGFAFLGGNDLPSLQANADAAAVKWQHLHSGTPVALFDLAADQEGSDVLLRWRTADEVGVTAFRVFRAAPGGAFTPLAPDVVPRSDRSYRFRDVAPAPGVYEYRIGEVGADGGVLLHGSVGVHVAGNLPPRTFLGPATPNPFNPTTVLRYGITVAGPVRLEVFDSRGRRIRTLVQAEVAAGFQRTTWDGCDDAGRKVPSGVYLAQLRAAGSQFTQRLVLLK